MGGENIISTARQHDPSSQSDWGCRGTQIQSGGGGAEENKWWLLHRAWITACGGDRSSLGFGRFVVSDHRGGGEGGLDGRRLSHR
jgi:hypothetical protein